ncbi:putative FAD-dependent oxidoreductase domain-containing protein 2 [Apostichopus japonicus]|uniref:Putative FAD-dependent oxidoreductase domain-containing protein 2 n=1 Tax=Stichopus japonicus TaxID=307972 RepID=A0A2G8KHH1_STIJA|nr:putative FAD-dependent oxidoreductase domain-containing protein 2 [Apostichopus japonicus]
MYIAPLLPVSHHSTNALSYLPNYTFGNILAMRSRSLCMPTNSSFRIYHLEVNVFPQDLYLIVTTGIATPRVPTFPGVELSEGYEDLSMDQEEFEGQSVLILGRGNSAFETADHIIANTNVIHMMARSRVRLAWATHYVGDLRAVNNGLLDTYQLKSLDGILEGDVREMMLLKSPDGKIVLDIDNTLKFKAPAHMTNDSNQDVEYIIPDNFPLRESYDRVIRCLGFQFDFSIFENDTAPEASYSGKYPNIKPDYGAEGIPGMYFAGTNSHSLDFRKSAGGFIHGFRYTARALHHILEYRNHQVPWPSVKQPITGLLDHIIKRMNEASGIYQMFVVLGDVIILHGNGLDYEYLEEFPLKMVHRLPEMTGRSGSQYIIISMEYGKHFSGPGEDIFRSERATGDPQEAHVSNFLHPVLYYYKTLPTEDQMMNLPIDEILPTPDALHHIVEDFLTDWTAPIR